jgi:hypothetical protein
VCDKRDVFKNRNERYGLKITIEKKIIFDHTLLSFFSFLYLNLYFELMYHKVNFLHHFHAKCFLKDCITYNKALDFYSILVFGCLFMRHMKPDIKEKALIVKCFEFS